MAGTELRLKARVDALGKIAAKDADCLKAARIRTKS